MTYQDIVSRLAAKKDFTLQWVDAKQVLQVLPDKYHIRFSWNEPIYFDGRLVTSSFWCIERIDLQGQKECYCPSSFEVNETEQMLKAFVKLPTVLKFVEMNFPVADLTILPDPVVVS